jgi:cysteinyl-tRNA synthetase
MPPELFSGENAHISKGYSPMVLRFFALQCHYRSPLDLTDEALQAAEKGYKRLMEGYKALAAMAPVPNAAGTLDAELNGLIDAAFEDMNDDMNTPKALARLFEVVTRINSIKDGHLPADSLSEATLQRLKESFKALTFDIFGLLDEDGSNQDSRVLDGLMQLIIEMRNEARVRKDWPTSDKIRDVLKELNIQLKDSKEGTAWGKG